MTTTTENAPTGASPESPAARRKRGAWIAAGAAVLALGGYLTAAAVISISSDPSDVVSSYLGAIAEGDASAAAQIVDPGDFVDDATYLTDDVLGPATSHIEVTRVTTTKRDGDTAEVEAEMQLAGQSYTHTFTVMRETGAFWLLQPGWRPDSPLTVNVAVVVQDELSLTGVEQVDLAGAELDLDVDTSGRRSTSAYVPVYPAVYELTGPDRGPYFAIAPAELVAFPSPTLGDNAVGSLAVTATEELRSAILDAAKVRADACVEPGTSTDAACPASIRQADPSTTGVAQEPYDLTFVNGQRFMTTVVFWRPAEEGATSGARTTSYRTSLVGTYTIDGDDLTIEFTPWEDQ
ncbi:hypothetical protein [Microbacterium sorbitolivorans]|uniref:DUF4878 domain-containing protein n=1 Tax=Microbacterium sorbitolivorans TaxID=1867410 RepID=A0A367Y6M2_9MICO|nr:hypothetical protein [Microbacterium sorbitolivorans]RCK61488.1 hypothetical protein DTO57_02255 [Microbacterium sorbitolivorans]